VKSRRILDFEKEDTDESEDEEGVPGLADSEDGTS
jgi:hypothetical protein